VERCRIIDAHTLGHHIGFVAGIIDRILAPGPNNPAGFILMMLLGIVGADVTTFIGQVVGSYGPNCSRRDF
jgi:uncharacterized membrane protein YeaQ/YmgE (transglycosylase-associated protein family)